MKVIGVLQARCNSSRLPRKILLPIQGEAMLARQIERVRRSRRLESLVVATSRETSDDEVEALCSRLGVACFRGSLDDVLDRFYRAAEAHRPDHVVRLTGDCPLADPAIIDAAIDLHLAGNFDYTSNCHPPTYPDGLDVEVVRFAVLRDAWQEATLRSEREHVMPFIWSRPERYRLGNLTHGAEDLSALRWTVDEPADYELVGHIYDTLYPGNPAFALADILALVRDQPALATRNKQHERNEGLARSLAADQSTKE